MTLDSFSKLGICAQLCDTLKKQGLSNPTEIQQKAIPPALERRNLVASAETGSGKTLAFLLPIIQRLRNPGSLRALVLAPTRELALQIDETAKIYGRSFGLRSAAVVGGESLARQINALRAGVDILTATPGRLNDLIERQALSLRKIEILILDEADRMLDMGFLPQVRRIVRHIPSKRQTMLLTATLSREVERLSQEMMTDPVRVDGLRPASTVAGLTQRAFPVLAHAKTPMLLALLRLHSDESFLVFTETKRGADRLARILAANKHDVVILHSDRNQSQRNRAMSSFRSGTARVLVATDVAARGIDIDDISFVVNYDVPGTAQDYIHRVGRTARAGRTGAALTLVSPEEESTLASIEHITGVQLERSRVSGFTDGRSEQQISLTSEIARLRSRASRSFRGSRASR